MRISARPLVAALLALAVLGAYGSFRYTTRNHWRSQRGMVDGGACPETRTLGGDCAACVAAECCAEVHACYSRADCIDLNDCRFKCAEGEGPKVAREECPAACERRHPGAVTAFHAWDDCARTRCPDACLRDPDAEEEQERRR